MVSLPVSYAGLSLTVPGIEQKGTPWSDGVPGLSQLPIESGDQFIYKWKATQYGSYFYHAHRRGQIDDGLYGAIHILAGNSVDRPFDKITKDPVELLQIREAEKNSQPILFSDWRRLTSEETYRTEQVTGLDGFCTNIILINGKGSQYCLPRKRLDVLTSAAQKMLLGDNTVTDTGCMPPIEILEGHFWRNISAMAKSFYSGCQPTQGPTEVIKVNPAARWVSFDLMTSAGVSTPTASIDEHSMYVYAIDGRYIEPIEVNGITISNGGRYSVFVKLNQPAGDYTIRAPNTGINQIINATATLSYDTLLKTQTRPSKPWVNEVGSNTTASTILLDETKVIPFPVLTPALSVDNTYKLTVDHFNASYRWVLGNTSFSMSLEDATPLLFNTSSIPTDLTITTRNGSWVDLIMVVKSPIQPPHPMHKHSNKYFVIGQGNGDFNYSSVAEAMQHIPESFNFKTPQIRDTFNTPAAESGPTWLAIRYQVVNPGPFLLHCHLQVHLSGGMAIALLDGVDKWPVVPEGYRLPVLEN